MNDEQAAMTLNEYNIESIYEINPQRHRISIDLTGNIIDDDNTSVSDDEEANNTNTIDNMSSKGHVNSLSDSFSRLNLKQEQSNSNNNSQTLVYSNTLKRYNSPTTHPKNINRLDSTNDSLASKGRSRFLRTENY